MLIEITDVYKEYPMGDILVPALFDVNLKIEKAKQDILAHCHKHLIKWSVPRDIEFRDALPQTLVGKVAYTKLEQEEASVCKKHL